MAIEDGSLIGIIGSGNETRGLTARDKPRVIVGEIKVLASGRVVEITPRKRSLQRAGGKGRGRRGR